MPLEVIQTPSSLSTLIRFKMSAIYELLVSLQTTQLSEQRPDWLTQAQRVLPQQFWAELKTLYDPLLGGKAFIELAAEYPDQEDVPGFISYVREMDAVTFVFYL